MYLTQSLGKVTGTYDYDDGKSEYPSYAPPDDAGDIKFVMSSDSNSFTGRWRYGSSGDWYSDWSGNRVSP